MEIIVLIIGALAGMIAGGFLSMLVTDKDEDLAETFVIIGGLLNWITVAIAVVAIIIVILVILISTSIK